jgi:hypothetical protein
MQSSFALSIFITVISVYLTAHVPSPLLKATLPVLRPDSEFIPRNWGERLPKRPYLLAAREKCVVKNVQENTAMASLTLTKNWMLHRLTSVTQKNRASQNHIFLLSMPFTANAAEEVKNLRRRKKLQ